MRQVIQMLALALVASWSGTTFAENRGGTEWQATVACWSSPMKVTLRLGRLTGPFGAGELTLEDTLTSFASRYTLAVTFDSETGKLVAVPEEFLDGTQRRSAVVTAKITEDGGHLEGALHRLNCKADGIFTAEFTGPWAGVAKADSPAPAVEQEASPAQVLPGVTVSVPFNQDNPCIGARLDDVDAVYDCFTHFHEYYGKTLNDRSRTPADFNRALQRFTARDHCLKYQMRLIGKIAVADGRDPGVLRVHRNFFGASYIPGLVDCSIIADLVEYHTGTRPYWHGCAGYDREADKAAHLKICTVNYATGRIHRGNQDAARDALTKMGCDQILRTYEQALGNVYGTYFYEGIDRGFKLPRTYSRLDCAKIAKIQF